MMRDRSRSGLRSAARIETVVIPVGGMKRVRATLLPIPVP